MLRPLAEAHFGAAWDDLAAHAAEPNCFAEGWFLDASRALPHGRGDVRLLTVERDGRLIGALPLHIDPEYGRLPIAHVETWLHYHSFLGAPLLRRGHEVAAWRAMLETLDTRPWARGLIHLTGLVEGGPAHRALIAAAKAMRRPCPTVHRIERAALASDMSPDAYYEAHVRKKKRKELKRLAARLGELGVVAWRRFAAGDDVAEWADAYLTLEAKGWKGEAGSALADTPATRAFFHAALAGAGAAGKLDMLRMELEGRPIAMLVNFLSPPGGFAFKTAFDEDFARFSPGVLLQIENLALLDRPDLDWIDSCAVEKHSMIDSVWAERRAIIRVTLPLAGARGAATYALARAAETAAARLRALRSRESAHG
ncbi:GNAT family N-acetyltransferase [Sphingomonas gilva]|uniref:GNAT family N-acetyltransferase n=1 Tax=Sphingomonas gilva TaxID=2305907 RepID=A0A396RQC0_9SPHN|nr:GNAT family N-acetyltransferase [Sphingomonas gilva]